MDKNQERVLRTRETAKRMGVARSTLFRWIRQGRFPKAHQYGPRVVGWPESVIVAHIHGRVVGQS
jgi:prophage regulatory protein